MPVRLGGTYEEFKNDLLASMATEYDKLDRARAVYHTELVRLGYSIELINSVFGGEMAINNAMKMAIEEYNKPPIGEDTIQKSWDSWKEIYP